MLILKAILMGAVQGVCEFFPVSSAGHVSLLGNIIGVQTDLFFMIMLHLGTLAAVVLYFRNEIIRCLKELAGILTDLYYNFKQLFARTEAVSGDAYYRKIISNNYRKLVLMLLVCMGPAILAGAVLMPLAELLSSSVLSCGMGFFITALILLVASYAHKNRKGPKEAKYTDALMIGAFQAVASFPGISRFAMTYCAGLFRGFSKKFAKLFSFLILIPSVVGAFFLEGARSSWGAPAIGVLPSVFGMLAAMAVGYYVISFAMKLFEKVKLKTFSVYCFCIGAVSVIFYLI